ncbi:sensor histidine kinase [Actinoplanes aureus]|uniref:histidine kinase n=1 Tax=Actinoplanes aureus TaxID=2792083 RepID=A0A931CFK3_9ACTN|nr:histidine kinase [Actinoplanes aureus]MBG0563995.1 histidine kinase [Actinoplanes aureus]
MARWRNWLLPALLAAAQLALWPGVLLARGDHLDPVRLTAVTTVVAVIAAALGFRHRHPVAVAVVVAAALALGGWITPEQVFFVPEDTLLVVSLAQFVTVFTVAVRCSRRTTALVLAGLTLWLAADIAITGGDPLDIPFGATLYAIVAAAGRLRGRWIADRASAAHRLAEAEQARREAADAERRRLARELHDVTAHHLTSIVVNASTAEFLGDQRPELRAEALAFAARTGREALIDLRRLVAVLPAGPAVPEPAAASLADLADDFRQLGQLVTLEAAAPGTLPPAVAEAMYGIAREALTNTLRYAPGAAVRIRLFTGPEGTELLVEDDGGTTPVASGLGSGRGLAGMRDRAAALGGTVRAGHRAHRGWTVRAVLPSTAPVPHGSRRFSRWLRSQVLLDAALMLLTLALPLSGVAVFAEETGNEPAATALVLLAVVAHAAPLLWRRQHPWTAFTAVVLTTWLGPLLLVTGVVPVGGGWLFVFSAGADLAAVYAVADRGARPGLTWIAPLAAVFTGALALALLVAVEAPADGEPATDEPLLALAMLLTFAVFAAVVLAVPVFGCWLAGHATRRRRQRRIDREEGAVVAAAAQAELRARDERARVAAGLHAAVLQHAARVPDAAEQADLPAVLAASKEALSAMRSLLDGLGPVPDQEVSSSQPG